MKLGIYRHFKGKLYEVVGCARYSEDIYQEFVVYRALYKGDFPQNQLWIRPKDMFLETIERDGRIFKRFDYVSDDLK